MQVGMDVCRKCLFMYARTYVRAQLCVYGVLYVKIDLYVMCCDVHSNLMRCM